MRLSYPMIYADLLRLDEELRALEGSPHFDRLHLDVCDGRFLPAMTMGLPLVRAIRESTSLPLDLHMQIENLTLLLPDYVEYSDSIILPFEAKEPLDAVMELVKDRKKGLGVSLDSATPAHVLRDMIQFLDTVLILSSIPGYGGVPFLPETLGKIAEIRTMAGDRHVEIQVEGMIDGRTITVVNSSGADRAVTCHPVREREERR